MNEMAITVAETATFIVRLLLIPLHNSSHFEASSSEYKSNKFFVIIIDPFRRQISAKRCM